MRTARAAAVALLAYAALVWLSFWPLWWPSGGSLTLGGDVATSYWQDVAFAIGSLRSGEVPLWNVYERGGYPFVSDAQTACFAPLSWLTWTLGLVGGTIDPWLAEFRQLATCALAGFGMHVFGRRLGLGHGASALGGVVMASGAFARRSIIMATYWPFAYLGFVLAAIEATVREPSVRCARWLMLALVALGTAGFPPSVFYCLIVAVVYATARAIQSRRRAVWLALSGSAVAAALALLVVVIPLAEQTGLSARAERGLEYVLSDAAELSVLWSLFDANAEGTSLYIGRIGLVGALASLAAIRGPRRTHVVLFAVLGAFGLALCVGRSAGVLELLATHVPGFDLFRVAARYASITHVALAVLAAIGTHEIVAWLGTRIRDRRITATIAGALPMVTAIDLARYERAGTYIESPDLDEPRALVQLAGDDRVYSEWGLGPRGGSVHRVRDWRGRSLDPMSFARYLEVEAHHQRNPILLGHFGVHWIFTGQRQRIPSRPRVRRPSSIAARIEPDVWRVNDPAAAAYWTADWRLVEPGQAVASMLRARPGRHAFVESELPVVPIDREPTPAEVLERTSGSLRLRVEAPAPGIVVVNEVWHPGWSGTIGGRPVEVTRVNHLVRGVVVDAGVHEIAMTFAPRAFAWTLPLFGMLVLGALLPGERLLSRIDRTPAPVRSRPRDDRS